MDDNRSRKGHCYPYQPQEKAKIERWFRTMKDHWMAKLDTRDIKTLNALRANLLLKLNAESL